MQSEASHSEILSFFEKPHPSKKDILRWRMVATMRRLFMVDPQFAEVTFAGEQYKNKIHMEWIAAGKLGPLDTYNLVRYCPWGLCQVEGNDLGCLPNSGTIPHYYMEIEHQQHTQWAIIYFMWGSF